MPRTSRSWAATGTPSSHLNHEGRAYTTSAPPSKATRTARARYGLVEGEIQGFEHVPSPIEWGTIFTDDVLATAILDRYLHHCEVITINGPSWRLKDKLTDPTPTPTTNTMQH